MTITAHCKARTLNAGTGNMAVDRKVAALISMVDMILGPVRDTISGGERSFVCSFNIRNISRIARPTVMNGKTCVLSKFIGIPLKLQAPKAAVVALAKTRVPIKANNDCIIHPYAAKTPITIPNLIKFVFEYSFKIRFTLAVEKVRNKYDEDDCPFALVRRSTS